MKLANNKDYHKINWSDLTTYISYLTFIVKIKKGYIWPCYKLGASFFIWFVWNLQNIKEWQKVSVHLRILFLWGFLSLPQGCRRIKLWKILYKIKRWKWTFQDLHQMKRVTKACCCRNNFVILLRFTTNDWNDKAFLPSMQFSPTRTICFCLTDNIHV